MRIKLPSLAIACDRTGVSDRAAAIIANAVLEDIGALSKDKSAMTIDRMKIRRARKTERVVCTSEATNSRTPVLGLFFDGRKDQTMVQVQNDDTPKRKRIVEEHIAVVGEPDSRYLGHITPEGGRALHIKRSLVNFLAQGFDTEDLISIGCDGTVVNTGIKNGVIYLLEKELGRPLQWLICLFHFNELPLRHLITHLDGRTSGPHGLTGAIGSKLEHCEELPVVNFERISSNLPRMNNEEHDLSTDQKYLSEIVQAIESGIVSGSLASKNPGKLSHARWLTTANRILRLYVATENPSDSLSTLVNYIMKVYAPFWFRVKLKPSCAEGARHLFEFIVSCRFLPGNIQKIIHPVIQRNAFFAHPENVLISLLTDKEQKFRELGIRRILKARLITKTEVRQFTIPVLNFDATHYSELIFWNELNVTEPPMTANMEISLPQASAPIVLPNFPCNTQAVERCVRLVSEASLSVCGHENREGFIQTRIKSRKTLPSFEKKSDYFKRR